MTGYWVEAAVWVVAWVALGLGARHLINRGERR